MIFDYFQSFFYDVVAYVISLFPDANETLLNTFSSRYGDFRGYMQQASWIFPANYFFSILVIILLIEFSLFTYRLIKLIVGYISLGFLHD